MSKDKKHSSHVTRTSHDSSSYDEVCINCGAKDISGAGWGNLAKPCKAKVANPSNFKRKSNKQLARMLEIRAHRLRGQIGSNVMTDYYLLREVAERIGGLK